MGIIKKIKIFISLDTKIMLFYLEAWIYLGWARFLMNLPFSMVAPLLGTAMKETSYMENKYKEELKKINDAIHIMSNHTFWKSQCLVKAIAGMKMLERRKIKSTLYLGTAKDNQGKMIAHAWLRSGSYYVTGKEEMDQFIAVGKFSKEFKLPKGELDG